MLRRAKILVILTFILFTQNPSALALSQIPSPSANPSYSLPWEGGQSYSVLQGNRGQIASTHNTKSMWYAWDFALPEGTKVVASRAGRVSFVEGRYPPNHYGGPSFANQANYVVIDHGDGTAALYLHLSRVSVDKGDSVFQGQEIGYSGRTGWTYGTAHLHFQVQSAGSWFSQSIPISFSDPDVLTQEPDGIPKTGKSYKSGNGPLRRSEIAYLGADHNLWIVNADGSNKRQIGSFLVTWGGPLFWSPDGRRILFQYEWNLWEFDLNRSSMKQLTLEGKVDPNEGGFVMGIMVVDGVYSPNGDKIVYIVTDTSGRTPNGLWVMNSDGSNRHRIVEGNGLGPVTWSPDGTKIAYFGGIWETYLVDVDGKNNRLFVKGVQLSWSPDGTKIVYTYCKDEPDKFCSIFVANADGTNPVQITNFYNSQHAVWSPDGRKLLVTNLAVDRRVGDRVVHYGPPEDEIFIVNVDDKNLKKLTNGHGPIWSPDGTQIAFGRGSYFPAGEIWIIDADGSNARKIAEGRSYAWRPPS